jgi:hypothetical protein
MSTTMLYRAADAPNPEVWDLKVEHRVFGDDDVKAALDQGWSLHPRDVEQPEDKPEGRGKGRTPKPEDKPEGQ